MDPLIETVFVSSVNLGKTCIQVYDAVTGACIKSFRGICVAPKSLCPLGSNDFIICGQKDKPLLQAWALNQNDPLQMRFSIPGRLNVMAVSQSEHKYCALGIQEKIYIYHLNTGCQFGIINRHYQGVTCLKFTSCGNYLASAGEDGFVYLWSIFNLRESLHKADRPQVQPHFVLGQHSDKVTGLCICGTGVRGILITSSMDHSAKVFDLVTGHLRHTIIASCGLTACASNAIGSQVFLAGEKGRVWGLNLLPQSYSQDLQIEGKGVACHESALHHMAVTTAGTILMTGGMDGEVKMWSIVMSERKRTFGAPSLALQKTLLVGRGAITNILVRKLDIEVFRVCSLHSRVVLSPFNNSVDILEADVLHHPRSIEKEPFDPSELLNLAADLFNEPKEKETKNKRKNAAVSEDKSVNETDLLAYVQKLKKGNEELYKFCLKHVLGED